MVRSAVTLRRGLCKPNQPYFWDREVEGLRRSARRAWQTYFQDPNESTWSEYLGSRQAFQRGVRGAKQALWKLFTEGPQDSKAMSKLYRHTQSGENKSNYLLNDTMISGLEVTLNHLMHIHIPDNTNMVEESIGPCPLGS